MDMNAVLAGIQERANNASPLGAKLKFKMGDNAILIDGTGEGNVVSTDDAAADCTVNVSQDDFNAILKGELNPMGAFMSGKIKIEGDMGLAMKLQSLLG